MGRRAWQVTLHRVAKSQTWLSKHTYIRNFPTEIDVIFWKDSTVDFSLFSESVVAQSCLTFDDPMDCSLPRNFPGKSTGVGCHFLLQEIFPTQGSNQGLPHCRQILSIWATRETLKLCSPVSGLENSTDSIVHRIIKSQKRLSDVKSKCKIV